MKLRMFQVDAFAARLFAGNPAAVVPLEAWLPDATLQAIALENNLAETAYFIPGRPGSGVDFELRWFTPTVEMDLCGHATLASAHVLTRHFGWKGDVLRFSSRSGVLEVHRSGERLELDFPARPGEPRPVPEDLCAALAARPKELRVARDWMAVFETEAEVAKLRPDMGKLRELETFAVIATAPADGVDFVSRFFAPKAGVDEDPATGSAHCTLIPYWAARLGKKELRAQQISARCGEFFCRDLGERVRIGGGTVTYLDGVIEVPA